MWSTEIAERQATWHSLQETVSSLVVDAVVA